MTDNTDNSDSNVLLTGSISKTLYHLTLPVTVGLITLILFQLVDTYFISLLGTAPLAAISFVFPVSFVITNMMLGLGVATTAVVAATLGRGDYAQARRLTSDSLLLATLIIVCVAIVGFVTMRPIFTFLGAPPDVLPLIERYMQWWFIAVCFIGIPMVGNNAIRATGDALSPMVVMSIAGLLNAILDPLLIFGIGPFPRLEIEGAAIATLLSWVFTLIVSLWILHYWKHLLTFSMCSWRILLSSWAKLLRIGVPVAIVNMLQPVSLALVTAMIAAYGAEAVAGFGIGARTQLLLMLVVNGLAMILPAFIAQNSAAGQMPRVRQAIELSVRFSVLFQFTVYGLLLISAPWLASLFSDDPQVLTVAQWFFWSIPISYGALGVLGIVSAAFNSLDKPLYAMLLNLVHLFVLYVPLAYLGAYGFDIFGLLIGCTLANFIAGILAYIWIKYLCVHYQREPGC